MNQPCFNCTKRHIYCHGDCLLYKQYKHDIAKIQEIKDREMIGKSYASSNIAKWQRVNMGKLDKNNRICGNQ